MSRRSLGVLVAAVLLVAACGDDDGAEPVSTTTSTTVAPAPETTARPATTETTTSVATPSPECSDAAPLPDGATAVIEEPGDVDGDGRPDVLRSYLLGDTWSLQVELAAGGSAVLELSDADAGGVGVIGGADVDGDGRDELWARVGSGASTAILGLARLEGCELVRVETELGTPADLPVGGSVGAAGGVECRAPEVDADLTVFSAVFVDEEHYEVTATEHSLEGTTLSPTGTTTEIVPVDSDLFTRATTFTCQDLVL